MAKNRKRQRTGPKIDDGRECVVCRGNATPQWRRIYWKGVETDACNRCGISHTDFTRRLKRDLGRAPTDAEAEAWGRERISPQATETTYPKCATYAASIIHSMRYPNSIYSSASPAAITSSTFPEFRIAPAFAVESVPRSAAPHSSSSKEGNRSRLSVEVNDYSSLSDPGLSTSSSDEESPLQSAIELESPTFVSFFSPDVLLSSDKENRAARNTAYEQRR